MASSVQSDAQVCNIALRRASISQRIFSLNDPSTEADVLSDVYGLNRDRALAAVDWPFARRRTYLSALGGAAWSGATAYTTGQFATLTATGATIPTAYVAIQASINQSPDVSPTYWTKVTRDEWAYVYPVPGDMVVGGARRIYSGSRNPSPDLEVKFVTEDDNTLGYPVLLCDVVPIANAAPLLIYTGQLTDPSRWSPAFCDALAWLLAVELATSIRKDMGAARAAEQAYEAAIGRAIAEAFNGQRPDDPPRADFIMGR
jgi:hypothetical protein